MGDKLKRTLLILLSTGIFASASLLAQGDPTTTEVAGCTYISEVQGISVAYNETEFKTLAQHVLYSKYGDKSKDLSPDVLASEWLDLIKSLLFSEELDPYIDITDAKYILGPNGLFSYLVNEINTLPVNNEARKADYILLLCISERIYADMNKFSYKDLEMPKPYIQLHNLAEKEIEGIQEQTGETITTTLDFYNKSLVSKNLGTKSFLASVKQLMIKDISNSNKSITTLIKETPSFYTKDGVELLISAALKENYLEKARDYLTKAKSIAFELPGKNEALASKLESAEKTIRERPANDLIERIKEAYPAYGNYASDKEVILKMLNTLALVYHGELKTLPLTQIALGTPENDFEDNIFDAYTDIIPPSLLITDTDRLVDQIRIMILCKNDVVQLSSGEKVNIVDFFSSADGLAFNQFFYIHKGSPLFSITADSFKDLDIKISSEERSNGLTRFNAIIEGILKK